MLNRLDDVLAPNLCQFLLIAICVIQLIFLGFVEHSYFKYILIGTIFLSAVFSLKVLAVRHERLRVYYIIKNRIEKRGYDRSIFENKCVSICQLTQATYIAIRFNSVSDFGFFWSRHNLKVPKFVMDDEDLEGILNKMDYSKVGEGVVIHEFKK
jgi:hypothetical protein